MATLNLLKSVRCRNLLKHAEDGKLFRVGTYKAIWEKICTDINTWLLYKDFKAVSTSYICYKKADKPTSTSIMPNSNLYT